jgi:diaminopimelate decarboxylase
MARFHRNNLSSRDYKLMDFFDYRNGVLHAEDVALDTIAAEYGTPTYVYSAATVRRHAGVLRTAFADVGHKICYAVKANNNLGVLRTLAQAGCGGDVVSAGEIRFALAAGMRPTDIVFSGVGKTREEMAYALRQGIFQFNVESEPELRALSAVADSMNATAHIAVRVNPDVDPATHAKIATGQKESKFGIAIARAPEVYDLAATLPGIRVQGVSVHIGSQLTQAAPFRDAFAIVTSFVKALRARGHSLNVLDLGGGLGIPYHNDHATLPPEEYAALARDAARTLECLLVLEPGRMIVGNAGVLLTRVLYVKEEEGRRYVIIDAGMNDLIRPAMYDAHHDIVPVHAPAAGTVLAEADVVGPVCESSDVFAKNRAMPPLKEGDLVVLRSAGAYGMVMACTYNARPLPAEVMVDGATAAISRPRQTYEQLLGAYV